MIKKLEKIFKLYNININKKSLNDFIIYYKLLKQWNSIINLTSIIEEEDVIFKHFLDSVLPYNLFKQNSKIIDIGSGAGFPSIPLKIIRPDLEILMVDSLNKRINFLNIVIDELKLKNISTLHFRADDLAHNYLYREKYDYAIARAVAKLPTLCEYLLPFTKLGGQMIAYKSKETNMELAESINAINSLGGKLNFVHSFNIKEISAQRKIIIIDKILLTDKKYPRDKNKPKLQPIL